jgi:hypothetical protein
MKLGARLRWISYAIAAAATAAAIWTGDPSPPATPEVVRATRSARPAAAPVAIDSSQRRPIDSSDPISQRAAASRASSNDPFAEEVQVAARVAAPLPAAPVTTAPAVPPLPYTYVGRWDENGRTVVYLQESGQGVVQVHGPGRLNERYAVESVTPERMVLKYLPLGLRQTLALARAEGGAPPTDGTMQAGAPGASRAEEEN